MHPLLQIDHLQVAFETDQGLQPALHDISLQVARGEIVAIVGESGSGKSVTALSVLQLLPAKTVRYKDGQLLFSPDGLQQTNLLQLPEKDLRSIRGNKIAMIFQEPMTSLNPVFTCGQQLLEAITQHSSMPAAAAKEKAIALLAKVQLPHPEAIYQRYPHQLSGGQKQRVMIAMAMSGEPSLLICDEPTTALDVTVQKTILQLIKDLQKTTGMGVIFITHDLGVVAEIADRVIVMYRGNIVETGTVQQVMQSPQHPYTKGLLACRPILHNKGERLPVVSDFFSVDGGPSLPAPPAFPSSAAPAPPAVLQTSPEKLLTVEQLQVWFPAARNFFGKPIAYTKAVDNVSFEVYAGETLGLVGESGCGKTTLGRALLRLIEPTGGSITYKGSNLLQYNSQQLRRSRQDMQIVFQDPYSSLNPAISIGNAIQEVLQVHAVLPTAQQRRERVMELLTKVSLDPSHFNRYPHEFSGGQRQRIVIARALALNPSFIVCDESISALDVSVQAQVLNLLNDLKKEFRFTIIFISHDLSVVHYISDRIMVMQKGQIVETGSADQVYNHPKEKYTQGLIASIPR
ncbi:MAG TPA: ABC transporter ATP-binding protein [Chitinophagaceae bacterium]|nr:ABC transporter ATP-binding protein [Chitinophagaceae bacterium]